MLKAIEFVKQCEGKVGREIAKRSKNQNDFMLSVIAAGTDKAFLDLMSDKCGELILPIIEYSAVGGVYHQLKGFFAECLADGIVGNELPQEKNDKKPRTPRDTSVPRAPRTTALPLTEKIRDLESKYQSEIQKLPSIKPDAAAMAVAAAFRANGNVALAEQIEAAANAAAQQAETGLMKLGDELLNDCMKVLFDAFGEEKVSSLFQPKKKA